MLERNGGESPGEGHCEVLIQDGGYTDPGIHGGTVWEQVLSKAAQFSRKERALLRSPIIMDLSIYISISPQKSLEVGLTCHVQEN